MEEPIMKKNLWILGGLMAMAFTACTEDDIVPAGGNSVPEADGKVSITAYTPGGKADSRIAFVENDDQTISLSWEQDETISVIRGGENQPFQKADESNTFEGVLPNAQGEGTYYAFYPANNVATDHTAVPYDLSVQTGGLNTNSTYMYAASDDGQAFQFHHSTAILKANFSHADWTEGTKIKQVKVVTPIATQGTANLTAGTLTGTGANLITISYDEPVATTQAAYIYLPPMSADNKTLVFMVTTDDQKTYSAILPGSSSKAIEAGKVYSANVALAPMNYLMFVASDEDQSLKLDVGLLQYSTDGSKWNDLKRNVAVAFENKLLFLRGKTPIGTNGYKIIFNNNVKVACYGDIRTLVDYENYTEAKMGNARFANLFFNCTSLTTAPELPATTLANECYEFMFSGCTSLTTAPELPATTLTTECYADMFSGCTSLTTAPVLPAGTLADWCYAEMFSDCTSLNSVTMLATDISANGCLDNWLYRVAPTGTLTHAPGMNIPGVPTDWTKVEKQ